MGLSPRQIEALETVAAGRFYPSLKREADGWHARWCAIGGADGYWTDLFVRQASMTPLSENAESQKHFTLHDAWVLALRSRTGLVIWDDAECASFAADLKAWTAPVSDTALAGGAVSFTFEQGKDGFSVSCAIPRGREALRSLGRAAQIVRELKGMTLDLSGGKPVLRVELSKPEADSFLKEGAASLVSAGYAVDGCDIKAQVDCDAMIEEVPAGGSGTSGFSAKVAVRIAGKVVSAEEIRFLLEQKSTLVFFRDSWIEVDRNLLKQALRVLERQDGKKLSVNEAVAFEMSGGFGSFRPGRPGPVRSLVDSLKRAGETPAADFRNPEGFSGSLMEFQKRGVAWMSFLTSHGFGALLADDMGLGKTVQTIVWILSVRPRRTLVAAPVTLLSNWRREFARFAPGLSVYVHHGRDRQMESGFFKFAGEADVVLSSHSLISRDFAAIKRVKWDAVVVDEAQAMKNPDTRLAKALCALLAKFRVALTGTPVENSPFDLWSLENFLNPGLLGTKREFEERFADPMSANSSSGAAERLKRILEPFVLRRLKTDPGIGLEIGGKCDIREYCPLSFRQRRAYENALDEYRAGERRRGDAFALITRLKFACDGDGKFERLGELADSIFDAGESVLVFSQYVKVAAAIKKFLESRTGRRAYYLDGSMDARAREREIASFVSEPRPAAFVLSLKTGGYGLNLVKASHVIHFDRWWNPAVESQATGRAHRIGQHRTVMAHLFISEGTLEEKIDALLERKSGLAGSIVSDGEAFLRSLAPDKLEEMVRLNPSDGTEALQGRQESQKSRTRRKG